MAAGLTRALAGAAAAALLLAAPPATAAVSGTVSGLREPASGTIALAVQAVADDGAGVRTARAVLDGRTVDTVAFGAPGCTAGACPDSGLARLAVDTRAVPDGAHRLAVLVDDGAGVATALFDGAITVANVIAPTPATVVLALGSGDRAPVPPSRGGGGSAAPGAPVVAGCRAPRLTVFLHARRLVVRGGAVVLRRDHRHRFAGRLTCRRDGARRAVARGTRIAIDRPGGAPGRTARTGADGRFAVRLRIARSGAVVFSAGRGVRVRIAVRVPRVGR